MTPDTPPRRRYRSELRTEQARSTRERILQAAAETFTRRGYAGTTIADIAASAGVSVETVKSHGPKRELLVAAFEQTFAGNEGGTPLLQQDPVADIVHLVDVDELLTELVAFMTEANRRAYGLWRAFRSAAEGDPAVAEVFRRLIERRDSDIAAGVAQLQRRGLVRRGPQKRREMTATTSFLLSPEGFEHFVIECGWPEQRYRSWTATALKKLVMEASGG